MNCTPSVTATKGYYGIHNCLGKNECTLEVLKLILITVHRQMSNLLETIIWADQLSYVTGLLLHAQTWNVTTSQNKYIKPIKHTCHWSTRRGCRQAGLISGCDFFFRLWEMPARPRLVTRPCQPDPHRATHLGVHARSIFLSCHALSRLEGLFLPPADGRVAIPIPTRRFGRCSSETWESCWVWKCKNYMNRFALKNIFMKVYIYYFLINIFREIRSQNYVLETVSLS